jgi:type IX secretion system PorP/SprF family membrane protein
MKNIILTIQLIAVFGFLSAQDLHFSQYWGSPLNLNPALAGVFDGNIRLNAQYRNQWFSNSTFATYYGGVDANLFKNKLNGNILGVGVNFHQDNQGEGTFKNTGVGLSLAYNQKLGGRKSTHYIGLGLQPNIINKQINLTNLIYGNLFEINNNTDPIDAFGYDNKMVFDFNAGFSYFANFNDKHNFGVGFSVAHIGQPNISFGNSTDDVLYRRFTANMSGKIFLNKSIVSILPTLLFHKQGPHQQINAGSYVGFLLDDRKDISLYVGAMYRMSGYENISFASDAFIGGARLEFQSLDVGLAYDITTSELRRSSTFMGGPELYLIYTIGTSPRSYKQKLNCPKF